MNLEQLKPCPFCGALTAMLEDVEYAVYRVRCQECSLQTRMSCDASAVISLWNTRAHCAVGAIDNDHEKALVERSVSIFGEEQPERIWLTCHRNCDILWTGDWPEEDSDEHEAVEYVRADIIERLAAWGRCDKGASGPQVEQLKPCPRGCDGGPYVGPRKHEIVGGPHRVECPVCGIRTRDHAGEAQAVADWNLRAKPDRCTELLADGDDEKIRAALFEMSGGIVR